MIYAHYVFGSLGGLYYDNVWVGLAQAVGFDSPHSAVSLALWFAPQ